MASRYRRMRTRGGRVSGVGRDDRELRGQLLLLEPTAGAGGHVGAADDWGQRRAGDGRGRGGVPGPGRRSVDLRGEVFGAVGGGGGGVGEPGDGGAGIGGNGDGDGDGHRCRRLEQGGDPDVGGNGGRCGPDRARGARGALRRDRRCDVDEQYQLEDIGATGRMVRGDDGRGGPGHGAGAPLQRSNRFNPARVGKAWRTSSGCISRRTS